MIRRAGLPGACTGLAAAARLATALALLDSGHQFALAHPAGAARLARLGPRRGEQGGSIGRRTSGAGGNFGAVTHEGSFPRRGADCLAAGVSAVIAWLIGRALSCMSYVSRADQARFPPRRASLLSRLSRLVTGFSGPRHAPPGPLMIRVRSHSWQGRECSDE